MIDLEVKTQVSFAVVVAAWLGAEWHYSFYDQVRSPKNDRLVREPNVQDESENVARYNLLYSDRHKIIDQIPADTIWYETTFTDKDIEKTFLISTTWCKHITGNSLMVCDAVRNFEENLKKIGPDNAEKIRGVHASVTLDGINKANLVFIAPDFESPWTVIEGNHRVIAFAAKAAEGMKFSCRAYVGVSSQMNTSVLYSTNQKL